MRRFSRAAAIVVALLLVIAGLGFWHFRAFRPQTVVEGVYRSSQPGAAHLARLAQDDGLKTVINLRGPNQRAAWFTEESSAAESADVRLISLPFETFDWPPLIETRKLVAALEQEQRPLLLHCESGHDRSGWAAGVVLLLNGAPIDEAEAQLSPLRGHFCEEESCALHQFFRMYRGWLAEEELGHSSALFRRWVNDEYCPIPYDARLSLNNPARGVVQAGSDLDFSVRVANASPTDWTAGAEREKGMRLGARLLGPLDDVPEDPVAFFRLARTPAVDMFRDGGNAGRWPAGEARNIDFSIKAPADPGLYYLQIDMVDEFVHWFSDLGREGLIIPFQVEPAG